MSPQATAQTKCPICDKKYTVPASACGHRVRCTACHTVFRVPKQNNGHPGHPTEDDIMRWLNDVQDERDLRSESYDEHDEHESEDQEHKVEPSPASNVRPPVKVEQLSDTQVLWRKTG